ncbi:hypothetical protein HK096_011557 [Nowakowskiella sp. JEL0078]|nr:hypothetical protein HK096_011557 [Nowakowskiella sp. JEL0078]
MAEIESSKKDIQAKKAEAEDQHETNGAKLCNLAFTKLKNKRKPQDEYDDDAELDNESDGSHLSLVKKRGQKSTSSTANSDGDPFNEILGTLKQDLQSSNDYLEIRQMEMNQSQDKLQLERERWDLERRECRLALETNQIAEKLKLEKEKWEVEKQERAAAITQQTAMATLMSALIEKLDKIK